MTVRTTLAAGVALLALCAGPARAQQAPTQAAPTQAAPIQAAPAQAMPVTPEQAKALETQIRGWLNALTGPDLASAPISIQVVPENDHFALTAPLHLRGPVRGETTMTATATPRPGGRWSITAIHTAVPFTFVLDTPVPPAPDSKAPPGAVPAPASATVPVTYTVNAASQDAAAEYDPSFATPSSWTTTSKDLTILAEGPGIARATAIAAVTGTAHLTPAATGRLDFASTGTLSGYTLVSKAMADAPAMSLSMATGTVDVAINGVSRDHVARLADLAATMGALNHTAAPGTTPKPPPEMVRDMLEALQNVASDMKLGESFQGIRLNVMGLDFAASQLDFGLNAAAEHDLVNVGMQFAYDGLEAPGVALGGLEALIPHRMTLHPYVRGLSAPDLVRLATAMDEKRDPTPAEIQGVFRHGPLTAGLDQLSLDLAGTTLTGTGKFTATSPTQFTGTAHLAAENFDALVQTLGGLPMAQQAMPAALFLKGIGKADGKTLVWDIDYSAGRLRVNNIDLSAMMGGPPAPRPAPGQNRTR